MHSKKILKYSSPLECYKFLQKGGVIAFNTDTVAGLGVDSRNEKALERLFALKNRPKSKRIVWLVPSMARVEHLLHFSKDATMLATQFWPGPLTLILKHKLPAVVKTSIHYANATQGVRVPNCSYLLAFLGGYKDNLAVTSANISGKPSCTNLKEVSEVFREEIASKRILCVNFKTQEARGFPSVVLDVSAPDWKVYRPSQLSESYKQDKKMKIAMDADDIGLLATGDGLKNKDEQLDYLQKIIRRFSRKFI